MVVVAFDAKKSAASLVAAVPKPKLVLAVPAFARSLKLFAVFKNTVSADSAAEPNPNAVLAAPASPKSLKLFPTCKNDAVA